MADAPPSWFIPDWPAPANVGAVVTTRDGQESGAQSPYGFNVGTRCGDDPAMVAESRAFLREVLALPAEPRWLRQVHGTKVITLDSPARPQGARLPPPQAGQRDEDVMPVCSSLPPLAGEGARRADGGNATQPSEADAAVARVAGVVLAIQTADCVPVLLCADDGSEIAAAHAGWRGLSSGVLEATLAAMHTPRANILTWLGPAIAAKSYEVGDEVRDAFLAHDPLSANAFTATRPGHWSCDLYELARQRLRVAGVKQIFGGGFDTFADPRFHSYRRDGAHSGRMVSLIWMAT